MERSTNSDVFKIPNDIFSDNSFIMEASYDDGTKLEHRISLIGYLPLSNGRVLRIDKADGTTLFTPGLYEYAGEPEAIRRERNKTMHREFKRWKRMHNINDVKTQVVEMRSLH